MASYAYKEIAYRADFEAVAARMKQENPDLEEGDFDYDGDGLVVVSELLDEKDAEIARLRAVLDEIATLGHDSHHGRGYTLATKAREALEGKE